MINKLSRVLNFLRNHCFIIHKISSEEASIKKFPGTSWNALGDTAKKEKVNYMYIAVSWKQKEVGCTWERDTEGMEFVCDLTDLPQPQQKSHLHNNASS